MKSCTTVGKPSCSFLFKQHSHYNNSSKREALCVSNYIETKRTRNGPSRRFPCPHIFDRVCMANGIEHRLTKPYHPWTNGQAERMNRTIKDATVEIYHNDDLESLKAHVLTFVTAYNFAKHLKALRWKTPYKAICDAWTKDTSILKINPHHLIAGPHT